MHIVELRSDRELMDAFPLMSSLRERLRAETFLAEVRRQQTEGYRIYGGFDGARLVALAGVRRTATLSRGEHLFVDDLVTADDVQGRGFGAEMLRWLARRAQAEGLARIYLDSRATARGFYNRVGFTFMTSIPAWIDVSVLAGDPPQAVSTLGADAGT